MEKLLLYYSFTGNCELVAGEYSKQGYEVKKIETVKKVLPNGFFASIMTGGFLAGIQAKSKIKQLDVDFDKYEEVIVCSPIWNGNLSSPINSLIKIIKDIDNLENLEKFEKFKFVFCSGSGEGKKAAKRINKLFPKSSIIFLKEPKKYPEQIEKLFK